MMLMGFKFLNSISFFLGSTINACSTLAFISSYPCVIRIKWMSVFAVSSVSLFLGSGIQHFRNAIGAKNVLPCRDRFKMVWINTIFYPTKMVELQSFWDFPLIHFVDKPMGKKASKSYANLAISIGALSGIPEPTFCGIFRNNKFLHQSRLECFHG